MKLSDLAHGRDNNFNLVRIVAALAVLVGHSYPLALGKGAGDPVGLLVGLSLGTIAVDVFFVTSGFLVTGSLLSRGSVLAFAWARALRIYPALVVMVALSVFVLGPFFTSVPLGQYFSDPKTLNYLVKNVILFKNVVWNLPGVFEHNPFGTPVNGSLWTLPWEVKLYTLLAAVWVVSGVVPAYRLTIFKATTVCFALIGAAVVLVRHFYYPTEILSWRLFFMFFTGAVAYIFKNRIVLSHSAFWLIAVALLLSAFDARLLFVVYAFTLAYALLYLAYIPGGRIRRFNRLGDYSYGVYIYAFPVQQSVAALFPGISVGSMIVIAAAVTLCLAALSWHFIERHALSLRSRCIGYSERLLARGGAMLRVWVRRSP